MRFVRLAVETRGGTLTVSFHPQLTLVTGVGSTTRDSMVQELLGGLSSHRVGTHLVIVTDDGRSLTIFRPPDAPHRVIETATGADVSHEFTAEDGTIDVLSSFGLDAATARRWSRIGPNDLVASTQSHQLVTRLARIDQARLWSDAQRVQVAKQALDEHEPETPVEDQNLTARIDRSYHAHDAALAQADRTRLLALVLGTASLAAAGVAAPSSRTLAIALLGIAVLATIAAFVFRARVAYYARQLESALGQSGSDSYLGYQLDRIDGYISSEHQRRHRAAAQSDVNEALARWRQTAGDVSVEWALEHRPAIEASANLQSGNQLSSSDSQALVAHHISDETPELIESLIARMIKARHLGNDGESFPLLLDEPFGALEPQVRPALLEALVAQSGSPQVILLTNSEDIISWARLEELTGVLSVVGPGDATEAPTDPSTLDISSEP